MTTLDFQKYDALVFTTRSYLSKRIGREPPIDVKMIDHALMMRANDAVSSAPMPYQIGSKNTAKVLAAVDDYLSWARLFPRILACDCGNLREGIVKTVAGSLFDECRDILLGGLPDYSDVDFISDLRLVTSSLLLSPRAPSSEYSMRYRSWWMLLSIPVEHNEHYLETLRPVLDGLARQVEALSKYDISARDKRAPLERARTWIELKCRPVSEAKRDLDALRASLCPTEG